MKYSIDNRGNAVGESNTEPDRYEIRKFLNMKGYYTGYIEIWFEEKRNLWMWTTSTSEI